MHKPARLHHVYGSRLGPILDLLPIHALVRGGFGDRDAALGLPFKGDEADVAVAHGGLAEEVNAVFYERMLLVCCGAVRSRRQGLEHTIVHAIHFMVSSADIGEVVLRVHVLLDAFEAVNFVIDVQSANVASTLRDNDTAV